MKKSNHYKIYLGSCMLVFFMQGHSVFSQNNIPASMYEQATEVSGMIVQYGQDQRSVQTFYGVAPTGGRGGRGGGAGGPNSPEEAARLKKLDEGYLQKLKTVNFDKISIYGQVDYILLKRRIEGDEKSLADEAALYQQVTSYFPFADSIYAFEKTRRRGTSIDGEKIARMMNTVMLQVKESAEALKKIGKIDGKQADFAAGLANNLKSRLKNAYDFYYDYDPMFTWWAPAPYKTLDAALDDYAKALRSKGDNEISYTDGSDIGGKPVGREELIRQLQENMIDYAPEDLLKLADQEYAWCMTEMLKASHEMGFGDDWKAAVEKVKNMYVPVGKQPELIIKLYNDAADFIKKNNLIVYPPLADETWGMIMMTPERQLVNPFFTGGREISVSYPTSTMSHEDKLMSMRGNNPYFSRGTVQHELIPGHNLQAYMSSRYKTYRSVFSTPFWGEGWACYWELLLYAKGFAKTPEERIGMLFWRMHRCARITFSLKFHLGEWTPKQCVDYLVDKVGHEYANAHGEVKRSFEANYGALYQLAYLVGAIQLRSLNHELVDNGKMSSAEFHEAVLKENSMPIEMVRATLTKQKLNRDYQTQWKFYDFNK